MCSSLMENQRRKKNCFCNKSQIFITTVRRQRRKMYLRHLKLSLKDISGFIIFFCHQKIFSFVFASFFKPWVIICFIVEKSPRNCNMSRCWRIKDETLGRVSHINTFITTINLRFFSVSVDIDIASLNQSECSFMFNFSSPTKLWFTQRKFLFQILTVPLWKHNTVVEKFWHF